MLLKVLVIQVRECDGRLYIERLMSNEEKIIEDHGKCGVSKNESGGA